LGGKNITNLIEELFALFGKKVNVTVTVTVTVEWAEP
jgi:hypothetical protein